MNEKEYPYYRRRDNTAAANNYNSYLLMKYNCHINVEYCTSMTATKYIHKYIHTGHIRG